MNLDTLTKEELIRMIEAICDEKIVDQYIEQVIHKNQLGNIKQQLDELFFPKSGMPYISLPEVENKIQEFEKICEDEMSMLELNVFYMECIIEFTQTFGMMGNDFYEHLLHTFEKVMDSDISSFQDKIEYIMGCMKYMDQDVYQKMMEIRGK